MVDVRRPDARLMLGVTATWGACFVTIRWGLRDAPALWFGALRALVAGGVLVAWGAVQRRSHPRGVRAWALVSILGLVNATLAFGAMFTGVDGSATGVAAVLANAQPLLILLPAWLLYGEQVSRRMVVGMAAGFAGLVVVAGPGGGGRGAWLSLLAAVGITGGTLLARRLADLDLVLVSGWHFVLGGAALAVVAAGAEGAPGIAWTPRFVASLAFLSLVGTALAFVVWFAEAQRSALGLLATWTFLVPVFGVAFGVVLLDERPGRWTVAGLVLVLAAMWAVLRGGQGSDAR